jgi:hypothetical protein
MKLGQASAVISPEMGMCGGDAECSAFMTLGKSMAADMDRAAADSQARTTDVLDQNALVVRGGIATAKQLQEGTKEHLDVPGLIGFSVQF